MGQNSEKTMMIIDNVNNIIHVLYYGEHSNYWISDRILLFVHEIMWKWNSLTLWMYPCLAWSPSPLLTVPLFFVRPQTSVDTPSDVDQYDADLHFLLPENVKYNYLGGVHWTANTTCTSWLLELTTYTDACPLKINIEKK